MVVVRSSRCRRWCSVLLSYITVVVIVEHIHLLLYIPNSESTSDGVLSPRAASRFFTVPALVQNATNLTSSKVLSNHSHVIQRLNISSHGNISLKYSPDPEMKLPSENETLEKPENKSKLAQSDTQQRLSKTLIPQPQNSRVRSKTVAKKEDTPAEKQRKAHEAELEKVYYRKRPEKVNPYLYDFTFLPKNLCDDQTFMMVIIHSFHPYTDRRKAIRDTWGRLGRGQSWPRENIDPKAIRLAFILGQHKDPGLNDMIVEEAERENDIIIGNFMDAYTNMTLKSLMGLKYFTLHCSRAVALVKSDDDMVINLPHLYRILQEKQMKWGIMGPLNRGSRVYRSGKWKMTTKEFPFKYFPPYESGATYVISADLVPELYRLSEYVPSIFIDDVYITGILGKMLNVTHVHQKGFPYWVDKAPSSCDVLQNKIVAGTKMTPDKLRKMWQDIINDVKICIVRAPPARKQRAAMKPSALPLKNNTKVIQT